MSPRLSIGDALVISGAVDILLSTCYLDILTGEKDVGAWPGKYKTEKSEFSSPVSTALTEH